MKGRANAKALQSKPRAEALLADYGVIVKDTKAETLEEALEHLPTDPERRLATEAILKAMLVVGKNAASKKFRAILQRLTEDNVLREMYEYQKQKHGRWSSLGAQTHNLKKSRLKPDEIKRLITAVESGDVAAVLKEFEPNTGTGSEHHAVLDAFDAITGLVRLIFIPAPDKRFIVSDFSAMEPRGLFYLAGDLETMRLFDQVDVYVDFEKHIFSAEAMADPTLADMRRDTAKTGVIGCGYGQGVEGFTKYATACEIDLDAAGVSAKTIVDAYRNRFSSVPRFWRQLQQASVRAVRDGQETRVGRLTFKMVGKDLHVILPSGRPVVYHEARIISGKFDRDVLAYIMYGHSKLKTAWGGKLAENLVCAFCRDVHAAAMVRLEQAGFQIVMHTHDECVVQVPAATAEHDVTKIKTIMEQAPAFAPELSMKTKPFITTRLHKKPIL